MNYFELFGLREGPSIDESLLAKKYFELQRNNHPDFFTQASTEDQERSLDQSADINKAFNIFQNKEKTIEYFLQEVGLITTDEKYALPADFFLEMMEINEALTEKDESTVKQQVADYEDTLYSAIRPVIDGYAKDKTPGSDLLRLKEYYYKKKYLNRILDRLGD